MFSLCVILVACLGTGVDSVLTIEMDRTTYALGDTAEVTIVNHAEGEAMFAPLCDLFVDGRTDEERVALSQEFLLEAP